MELNRCELYIYNVESVSLLYQFLFTTWNSESGCTHQTLTQENSKQSVGL